MTEAAAATHGPPVTATWEDIDLLRAETALPIALKGILAPTTPAGPPPMASTPSWSPTTAGARSTARSPRWRSDRRCGRRRALSARAVLYGRPFLWGLGAGVLAVLRGLLAERDLTVALSGHTTVAELHPELLATEPV